ILRNGGFIDAASISDNLEIIGSVSGKHDYSARLSDDNKTVIIKPKTIFNYGETVTVNVHSTLKTIDGQTIEGTTFSFKTRNEITAEEKERYKQSRIEEESEFMGNDDSKQMEQKIKYPLDSMPTFQITHNENPPGRVFYCNQQEMDESNTNSFPTIIENDGTIVWARDLGRDGHDFKINYNGYLTYYSYTSSSWMVMDSNYNLIDSVECGNGYADETNGHDMVMYPNGHVYLFAYNDQTVDMTAYGGINNATVKQIVLQELDASQDVIFEWRSFDHFEFTDAIAQIPLTNSTIDYCHTNSIERDFDGNILISSRNFSELTKINSETGDIIWRMGGENNQFTFVNDNIPQHFSQQHDLRRLPNGHITIFNNGNYLPVERSSAKEYALDEVNKIATLVWYYEHPNINGNNVFGRATGSTQRLANGNTMICWGTIFWNLGIPNMTEVNYQKQIVWEMVFDETGQKSYRSHRYLWNPCSRITGYTMKSNVQPLQVILSWRPATGAKAYEVSYRKEGNSNWVNIKTNKIKISLTDLAPNKTYEWKVKSFCSDNPSLLSAYSDLAKFTTDPLKVDGSNNIAEPEVVVYPVPAEDRITMSFNNAADALIIITDVMGKIMYQTKCNQENESIDVEVANWVHGLYIVEVKTESFSVTRKFIVN
nr:aryl-sulfate sulfotransferase [Chitinophagales bacterium]